MGEGGQLTHGASTSAHLHVVVHPPCIERRPLEQQVPKQGQVSALCTLRAVHPQMTGSRAGIATPDCLPVGGLCSLGSVGNPCVWATCLFRTLKSVSMEAVLPCVFVCVRTCLVPGEVLWQQ